MDRRLFLRGIVTSVGASMVPPGNMVLQASPRDIARFGDGNTREVVVAELLKEEEMRFRGFHLFPDGIVYDCYGKPKIELQKEEILTRYEEVTTASVCGYLLEK